MSDTMEETNRLSDFLVLFGALLSGVHGVLFLLNFGMVLGFLPTIELGSLLGSLTGIGIGILLIFFSIITIAIATALVKLPSLDNRDWIPLLVLGVIMYLLGGTLGGLLVIMGSILKLI